MRRKSWFDAARLFGLIVCPFLTALFFGSSLAATDNLAGRQLTEARLQQLIDSAPSNSVVRCDPNDLWILSAPVKIRKPLSLVGLHAQLPPGLGSSPLVVVASPGVAVTDFDLIGNGDSVPQKDRAPLLIINAGDFRVERGSFLNSSKDGVMIDGDELKNQDLIGGVVRDIVGRRVRRDVVSISGSSGNGPKIRNVLVDNIRCYDSDLRGAVEVSDGTDNITVRKVYAEASIYAIDVQDHKKPGQSNRNVIIEDIYALRCKHAIRTANSKKGHNNLIVRDVTADRCVSPVQISHTDNVFLDSVRVLNHEGNKPPIHLLDCRGLSVRNVLVENAISKGTAILLENCDQALVDGVTLRGSTNTLASAVCFRITKKDNLTGLRIRNVSAPGATDAGIVLEIDGKDKGALSDYLISGNLATVADRIHGARSIIADNLP